MENKASLIVMSHLSDVQSGMLDKKETNNRINFVKWIMIQTNNDLNKDIDVDKIWEEFTATRFYKQ